MDIADIKNIKNKILENLYDMLEEKYFNVLKTDRLSLIVIFGEQKKPTQFDIEIKFHTSDDFETFDIISPITKKILNTLDLESLNGIDELYKEIEEKYESETKKAKTESELKRILTKKYNERSEIVPVPKFKPCVSLSKEQVVESCEHFFNSFQKIMALRFNK